MPKGKIFLSAISPKYLFRREQQIVARQGGLVKILKVWPTKIDYYFLNEPGDILMTSFREGFFSVLAYMPQALNKNGKIEEEDEYLKIRQSELQYAIKFLVKIDATRWELDFNTQMAKAKIIQLFIDDDTQEKTVILDRRRLLSLQLPGYTPRK